MIKVFNIHQNDVTVQYSYSEAGNAEVVRRIVKFCEEHNISCTESALQDDDFWTESPSLLAGIIDDILKFKAL